MKRFSYRLLLLFPSIAVALLYNDWLLGPLLNPKMPGNSSLISELSAQTQPHHWIFRLLDITAGIVTLLCVRRVARFLHSTVLSYHLLLLATFICIGADSILDALLPIACAPSVNAACNLGAGSIVTQAHLVESTVVGVLIFAAPLLWWWTHRQQHRFVSQASGWFVVAQVSIGATILLSRLWHIQDVGYLQRVYQAGLGVWLASLVGAVTQLVLFRNTATINNDEIF